MSTIRKSVISTQSISDANSVTTVRRGLVVMCLVGIALIHLLDVEEKLDEAPFIGALFIALIVASLLLAEALIRYDEFVVWAAAGAVAAATVLAYILSRSVGLASLLIEGLVVWMVAARLSRNSA
jgi:DMSO reductase anchor subunit